MRFTMRHAVAKRPFYFAWQWIILGLMGIVLCLGTAVALLPSQFGQLLMLFARVIIHLVPPRVWLGGIGLVVLWLAVLNYLWRERRPYTAALTKD